MFIYQNYYSLLEIYVHSKNLCSISGSGIILTKGLGGFGSAPFAIFEMKIDVFLDAVEFGQAASDKGSEAGTQETDVQEVLRN